MDAWLCEGVILGIQRLDYFFLLDIFALFYYERNLLFIPRYPMDINELLLYRFPLSVT